MSESERDTLLPPSPTKAQRWIVLAAAFFGWTGAGMEMSTIPARPAALYFIGQANGLESNAAVSRGKVTDEIEAEAGFWTAWYNGAFLLGAAVGGLVFGSIGDRIGRVKALSMSILCYSLFTGVGAFAPSIEHLITLRFLAGLGVGGVWPTGVALATEVWAGRSRAFVSGTIGTGANVGLTLMGLVCARQVYFPDTWNLVIGRNVTIDDWRWVMLVGATPTVFGILVAVGVPESASWKTQRLESAKAAPVSVVFRSPYLGRTIIGILLGTVPLLGGWGSINWVVNWSDKVGQELGNASLKAHAQTMRSSGAIIGSFLGGWLASHFGRRTTYFGICLGSLLMSGVLFWLLTPRDSMFLPWVFMTGVIATTAFGWLPLYLPELFPTQVRATGTGVTFNFGRILTAACVLTTAYLMQAVEGDYARIGRVTHLIFLVGMVVILFAPDTTKKQIHD